jgi:general secretion pathway protein J
VRPHDTGFTLLEMLVAVTLLAFLSLALVAGLRFGSNIWQKSQARNVDTNTIRASQRTISDAIARIYPRYVTVPGAKGFIDFDGTSARMTFLSTASSPHISRETLEVADGTMRITTSPELASPGAPAQRMLLLRQLAAAEFSYFDGTTWRGTWQRQRALPSLIRIHAAFAPAGATPWPDMILMPRIAADVDCTFDTLVKFCRDRP